MQKKRIARTGIPELAILTITFQTLLLRLRRCSQLIT